MSRLLISTFAGPRYRTGIALKFRTAVAPLLTDRLDDAEADLDGDTPWNRWPADLNDMGRLIRGAPPLKHEDFQSRLLAFMRWSASWAALIKAHPVLLERWLNKLHEKPIHCWLIGGHHHGQFSVNSPSRYRAMVWGSGRQPDNYLPYCGLGIASDDTLEYFGYAEGSSKPLAIRLPQARASLREARLVMITGCNGVPIGRDTESSRWLMPMSRSWQEWLAQGSRRPMIAGWFQLKDMPPDDQPAAQQRFASDLFGQKLRMLAAHLGNVPFVDLFSTRDRALQVAQCWGAACYQAFADRKATGQRPRRILWEHCGVLAPDKGVWHANGKYKGAATDPPFAIDERSPLTLVGTAP